MSYALLQLRWKIEFQVVQLFINQERILRGTDKIQWQWHSVFSVVIVFNDYSNQVAISANVQAQNHVSIEESAVYFSFHWETRKLRTGKKYVSIFADKKKSAEKEASDH